eukprot:g518.t1
MDVLEPELVINAVGDDTKFFDELKSTLPDSQTSVEDIKSQLRSPQLRQAVNRLSSVINSPQYGTVMASLGLQNYTGGAMGVSAFLDAIRRQAAAESVTAADTTAAADSAPDEPSPMEDDEDDEEDEVAAFLLATVFLAKEFEIFMFTEVLLLLSELLHFVRKRDICTARLTAHSL